MRSAESVVTVKTTDGRRVPGSSKVGHDQFEGSRYSDQESCDRFLSSSSPDPGHRIVELAKSSVLEVVITAELRRSRAS
jgi:DNA repair exonuclease SbcCD ATPase subunit